MSAVLLSLLIVGFTWAQEVEETAVPEDFSPAVDQIAENYWTGAYLMYDCEEGHWVCVLQEDYSVCEEKREKAKLARKKHLPCAPIGKFPTKRSCFQRELFLTGQAHGHRFCLLDELKREERE